MAVPLRVTVSPERVSAASGDSPSIGVTVRNTSDIVDHYEIEVTGLPEGGSFRAEPDVTKLRPGETGEVTVHIVVAADPPAAAGEHTLGLVVRSRYRPDVSRCEEVTLTIAPIDEVTLRIEPELVTGGRFAHYAVSISNDGNTPVALRLTSTDPERHVTATFQPATLDLPPGASAQSTMSVTAPIPWSKEKKRTLKINANGAGVTSEGSATFVQRPRFAPGVTRTAGVLGAVLVLAGAIVAAAVLGPDGDGDNAKDNAKDGATATAAPAPSSGGPDVTSEPPPGPTGPTTTTDNPPQRKLLVEGTPVGKFVKDDKFDGLILGGLPETTGECTGATAVAVRGDADDLFLTAALREDDAACSDRGVRIRFTDGAASVTVFMAGGGVGTMRVVFKDGEDEREDLTDQKTLTADRLDIGGVDHGGIDYVQVQIMPTIADPTAQGGVQSVEYTRLAA